MLRVRFYVDGFNFYYGVTRPYEFKWVDLEALLLALVRRVEPEASVERILLFAAAVKGDGTPGNAHQRQQLYFEALKAHSKRLEIVHGRIRERVRDMTLVEGHRMASVVEFEEKGTDVNLACRMVEDAYEAQDQFDVACLVSNDSDLAAPLKVKQRLGQRTMLITPRTTRRDAKVAKELTRLVEREDRILTVPEELVKAHPLPKKVGRLRPPKRRGWRVHGAAGNGKG